MKLVLEAGFGVLIVFFCELTCVFCALVAFWVGLPYSSQMEGGRGKKEGKEERKKEDKDKWRKRGKVERKMGKKEK